MNKKPLFVKLITCSLLVTTLATPVFAIAQTSRGEGMNRRTQETAPAKPSELRAFEKVKVCQRRETTIKKRMTQLTKLVTTMETAFDKITERVKIFYSEKVLPSGKTVANYDLLLKDISTKKTLIQTQLDKANLDIKNLDCSSENVKVTVTQFRTDMQIVKDALKDYRKSINTLIVAVHSVNKDLKGSKPTTTNTPTAN